jgi:hypothetical protein
LQLSRYSFFVHVCARLERAAKSQALHVPSCQEIARILIAGKLKCRKNTMCRLAKKSQRRGKYETNTMDMHRETEARHASTYEPILSLMGRSCSCIHSAAACSRKTASTVPAVSSHSNPHSYCGPLPYHLWKGLES